MSHLPSKNQLTLSQRECAKIFATNDVHKMTIEQIADHIGVTTRTLYRWKQDRTFIQYQNEIAETAMEDVLTEAYAKLKTLLREGKSEKTQLEALKLILQNRGKLVDKTEHTHGMKETKSLEDMEKEILEMEHELLD